jgi:hypothetical protein
MFAQSGSGGKAGDYSSSMIFRENRKPIFGIMLYSIAASILS